MNITLRYLPVAILCALALVLSPGVFAQGLNDASYSNPQPYLQDGTNNVTTTQAQSGAGTSLSMPKLDWRWILPLIVVGLGVLLLGGGRETVREERKYYNPSRDYTVAYHEIDEDRVGKRRAQRKLKSKKPLKSA